MSTPVPYDPAVEVIDAVVAALAEAFDPDSEFPPPAGGTTVVHFFAGEGPAVAAWTAYGCDAPFLWVRVMRRYRTRRLPEPAADAACSLPRAVAVEVGVARCAVVDETPTWQQYDDEADTSLDDSWRIELALCRAVGQLKAAGYTAVTEEVLPQGPEGGILLWSAVLHAQFA